MVDLEGLLEGAVDLHRHGYPEISDDLRTPISDVDDIALCREAGMAGVVLKSHIWPTMGRAQLLEKLVPGIRVVSSVTLNSFAGGMRPEIVELAGRQGAGVVFFPTASARNDVTRGGISSRIAAHITAYSPEGRETTSVLDDDGELTSDVLECLDVFDQWPMAMFSGHLSTAETLAIAATGRVRDRMVFAHPDSDSIGAADEAIVTAAKLGLYIEICALGVYPQIARVTFADLAHTVRLVGADRCVMSSDYFFPWCPPSSVMLMDLAAGLAAEGISRAELETMLRGNPRNLVG